MTWKNCIKYCCFKVNKTADNVVAVGSDLEDVQVLSDTTQKIEDVTPIQSAEAVSNETLECVTGNERNRHQGLNDQTDKTNVNEQTQCYYTTELSGNSKNNEENVRKSKRENRTDRGNTLCSWIHGELLSGTAEGKNLDAFCNYLYGDIEIKRSDDEVDAIRKAVENLVTSLINKVGESEPVLKSSELVRTGSCYDGTKILQPDEFDFLAVIDCLSLTNLTNAEDSTESCSAGGYAHAVCKQVSPDWSRVIEQDGDHCIIASLKSRSLRTIFRERFHLILLNEIDREFSVETQTGFVHLEGFSVPLNGPQCSVQVIWTPKNNNSSCLPIDIDISPAIKCSLSKKLTKYDVINDDVFKMMSNEQYVYLIPRPKITCNKCFKMVFPRSDQRLVMELTETHRKVLLILKYLSHEVLKVNFRLKTVFNSFAMKIAVLHHSLNCKETHRQSISLCLMSTLDYMTHKLDKPSPELISVFTASRNVWNSATESEIIPARAILRKVTELFNKINDSKKFQDFNFHALKRELLFVCLNSVPSSAVSNRVSEKYVC